MKLFASVALVLLWADIAGACSCRPPDPPLVMLGRAKVAFAGEVVAMRDSFAVDSAFSKQLGETFVRRWGSFVTLRVFKWWKWNGHRLADDSSSTAIRDARADTLVTVWTSGDDGSCRYEFKVGEQHLIYGHEPWGLLGPWKVSAVVSMCSRSRPLIYGWTDIVALGVTEQDRGWMTAHLKVHSFPGSAPDTSQYRHHFR